MPSKGAADTVNRYERLRWGACGWACMVLAWGAICLLPGHGALALAPPRPPEQAVAVVSKGVVWFDEGPVYFDGFQSESMRLGAMEAHVSVRESVASSPTAVVVGGGQAESAADGSPHFLAGIPPAASESIPSPPRFAGAGCKSWEPGGAYVLAVNRLVVAGKCFFDDAFSRQPLFIRNLHARRWHILGWLPGEWEPMLAAEGSLLAVGVQRSPGRMDASIIDLRNGYLRARFKLPDGRLSFASRNRLVLAAPVLREAQQGCFPISQGCEPYELSLYSTRGRRIADLGGAREPPLVSDMHLLTRERNEGPLSGEEETLSVRDLRRLPPGGAPVAVRRVIGFDSPARSLLAFAFRWPALAVIETTSAPRQPSEIHCFSGDYKPPGKPFLQIFDLARNEPFQPAPPVVDVQPSEPLTNCGPVPPEP